MKSTRKVWYVECGPLITSKIFLLVEGGESAKDVQDFVTLVLKKKHVSVRGLEYPLYEYSESLKQKAVKEKKLEDIHILQEAKAVLEVKLQELNKKIDEAQKDLSVKEKV